MSNSDLSPLIVLSTLSGIVLFHIRIVDDTTCSLNNKMYKLFLEQKHHPMLSYKTPILGAVYLKTN